MMPLLPLEWVFCAAKIETYRLLKTCEGECKVFPHLITEPFYRGLLSFHLPAMDVGSFSTEEGGKGVCFYGVEWPLPMWASPHLPRKGLKPERKYTVKYFKATERCKEL